MKASSFFIIMLLIGFFTLSPVSADVINPGEKEVPLYYQITNLNSYPDYIFLLHGSPSPTLEVINGTEFTFYKLSTATIFAVRKSDYNLEQLLNLNQTEQEKFTENSTQLIPSDVSLDGDYGPVNQMSTLDKVVVELEITSLNQTELSIRKINARYYYADGSSRTVEFKDQNITAPPDTSLGAGDLLWYFLLPLMAVIVILLLLIRRRSG